MKKVITSFLLVFFAFILQSTLFSQFHIAGIVPNLLIIVTSTIGFLCGRKAGMIVGFVSGLLLDVSFGSVYGISALIYVYIGFANGSFRRVLFPEDIKLPLLLICASDFIYGIATYLLRFLLQGKFDFFYYLIHIILPELVYTVVLAGILYPLIHLLYKKLDAAENKGEQNIV